jgi:hypothetical protein
VEVEQEDPTGFGGGTSEEIRVHSLGIHRESGNFISKTDTTIWYPNGDEKAKEDQVKRERSMDQSGAELALMLVRGGQRCGFEFKWHL